MRNNTVFKSKYKGKPTGGKEFFNLLFADNDFCSEIGRTVLAASRLETELRLYLGLHAPEQETTKATLGRLIGYLEKKQLLLKLVPILKELRDQRDYLTHRIFSLLTGVIEETILEGSDLLDSDVSSYTDRAFVLRENLIGLAEIIARENSSPEV